MATPYNPLSRRFVMMNMAGLLACLGVTFPFTIVNSGLRKHDPKKWMTYSCGNSFCISQNSLLMIRNVPTKILRENSANF